MRAHEFITEYETRNLLYHGVPDGKTVGKILSSGYIKPQEAFEGDVDSEQRRGEESPDRISLTRNQFLHFPYGGAVAQFVIDRDALKRYGYKIKPTVGLMIPHKGETEEQVFKPIPVRSPFIVGLQYDPIIEIPKTVLSKLKKLGIEAMPWKSHKEDDDTNKHIEKTEFKLDPENIKVKDDVGGSYVAYVGLWPGQTDPYVGTFPLMRPSKDKNYVNDLAQKVKDRVAKQLDWRDLLPQDKFGKNWKQGTYRIPHGTPEYDKA
jgi:hypothetical protein